MRIIITCVFVGLLTVAGHASATIYSIVGAGSYGVNYAGNLNAGELLPGDGVVGTWDASDPSSVPVYIGSRHDALISSAGVSIAVYITSGWYDDQTEQGRWDLVVDLTGFGSGQQQLTITDQLFNLSRDGLSGILDPADTCTGDFSGCLGLLPAFQGDLKSLTGEFVYGSSLIALETSLLEGDIVFRVCVQNLEAECPPIDVPVSPYVPVPAAAWLFGSALIGLVGLKRR